MTKKKMQVVLASAEAAPFVKTGGLGDVAGSLPAALVKEGADVIVLVPKYSTIPAEYKDEMEHIGEFYVSLCWRNEYCGMERLVRDGVTYIFLDNERYFDRSYPYGFFDDGERFAFFSKAVTECLQHLPDGFECDVLHCNDWHTAMAPVFLREFYQGLPLYENVKTVFTIHNIAFQGQFSDKMLGDVLGLEHVSAAANQLRCDASSINFMQGALSYSDAITTVSPSYAREIKTSDYGEGLDWVLRRRSEVLSGILNGIDTAAWDPATDTAIAANYSLGDMAGKAECKAALQRELGLEVRDDRPLMVMVTRLTRQKGMDLVTYSLDRILSGGVQVAVLGTGDYEEPMNYFANKYPGSMAARITFDSALSRRMYAGADLFLMPSLFEPCGLSQIIAMRYGTLPVVRETGGLRDTVIPYNYETGEGTGFSFANFNGDEMGDAVFRGARLFWDDREAWNHVVEQAMQKDFSWKHSAEDYMKLYHRLHPEIDVTAPPEAPAAVEAPVAEPEPAKAPEPAAPAPEPEAEKKPAPKPKAAAKPKAAPKAKKAPAKAAAATDAEPAAKTARRTTTKAATAKKETAAKTAAKSPAAKASTTKKAAPKKATASASAAKEPAPKRTARKASTGTAASKAATTKSAAAKSAAKAEAAEPAPKRIARKASAGTAAATKGTAAKSAAKAEAAEPSPKKPAAKRTSTRKAK